MIRVHSANQRDLGPMVDIDMRSYEYPLSYVDIKQHLQSRSSICIIAADDNNSVIGYAIFKVHSEQRLLEIVRLAVEPKHRCQGAGKDLLRVGIDLGSGKGVDKVFVVVPELLCVPNKPGDVSRWLSYAGFRAVQVLKNAFVMYGSECDGYKFTKDIGYDS